MAKETPFKFEQVIYEKENGVGTLIMNNPKTLNALSQTMSSELQQAFLDGEKDPAISAFILTGSGDRAFSSGADLSMGVEGGMVTGGKKPEENPAGVRRVATPGSASPLPQWIWRNVEKPLVAAVNGVCAGMGGVSALASDIRIMSENARFAHVYNRRGLVVSGESWFLPRIMGLGPALYHIMMADDTFAEEALRLGLVSKVVPQAQLLEEARNIAEHLADGPQTALRFTKKAVYKGLNLSFFDAMDQVGLLRAANSASNESREGFKAFAEKRKPAFSFR